MFLADRPDLSREYKGEAKNAFDSWLRSHPQMQNKGGEAIKIFFSDREDLARLQNLHEVELQNLSWLSSLWSSF